MVISSDFRMGEHRDDDHEEDALYFSLYTTPAIEQGYYRSDPVSYKITLGDKAFHLKFSRKKQKLIDNKSKPAGQIVFSVHLGPGNQSKCDYGKTHILKISSFFLFLGDEL